MKKKVKMIEIAIFKLIILVVYQRKFAGKKNDIIFIIQKFQQQITRQS